MTCLLCPRLYQLPLWVFWWKCLHQEASYLIKAAKQLNKQTYQVEWYMEAERWKMFWGCIAPNVKHLFSFMIEICAAWHSQVWHSLCFVWDFLAGKIISANIVYWVLSPFVLIAGIIVECWCQCPLFVLYCNLTWRAAGSSTIANF